MNADQQANIETMVRAISETLFSAWSYFHLLEGFHAGSKSHPVVVQKFDRLFDQVWRAVFTLGLLLFSVQPVARGVFIVPLLWAAVGSLAAFQLGVIEDLGLLAAGIATIAVMVFSPAPANPLLNARAG